MDHLMPLTALTIICVLFFSICAEVRLQMRLLKEIEFSSYRALKHARLKDLGDFNVIIGPNNCGKTSILNAIALLGRIGIVAGTSFLCPSCNEAYNALGNTQNITASHDPREEYLLIPQIKLTFAFNMDQVARICSDIAEKGKKILETAKFGDATKKHLSQEFAEGRLTLKQQPNRTLIAEHISVLIDQNVKQQIFNNILFCPEDRLQSYKGNDFPSFLASKDFTTTDQAELTNFIKEVIDSKIVSMRHSLNLVKMLEEKTFDTTIAEQGSGVKSLLCLVADILSEKQAKILLIDEPELGLNPSAKHAFLKFLLRQSEEKQIFLSTHDPTFVNPILWKAENTSVYLFSTIENDFVKVNLAESRENPDTFAGYLPHTTSLKQIHIYVEGSLDVYILQAFLENYVKMRFHHWYRIFNKVGIYHLAGDFWMHLLYTIPKKPYASIVILDGDKKELAIKVLENFASIEKNRFEMLHSLDEIRAKKSMMESRGLPLPCYVYCLKHSTIEEYLDSIPNPKEDGPLVAYEMKHVPQEIEKIFETLFSFAGIQIEKRVQENNEELRSKTQEEFL